MENLFRTSTTDIENGVVSATTKERIRFFGHWRRWLSINYNDLSTNLQELSRAKQVDILAAYGRHVRNGCLSPGKHKASAQTVALAFRAIATQCQLDSKFNPLAAAQGGYPKKIGMLLEGYRREDPPPQPRLAVPVAVPNLIYMCMANKGDKEKCVGDLSLIAFYYLLRVGEYTHHKPSDKRRTQQFRLCDIAFWHNNTQLDASLSITHLLQHCTAATLNISNQKNGIRAQTIHQEALNTQLCPVRALIRRVKYIRTHTADINTIIATYYTKNGKRRCVSARMINNAVKNAVTTLGLEKQGLQKHLVGSHSLRAGGAMAMHLQGISDTTIKKLGRWSTDTFLMYIHSQISAFSRGLSKQMSTPVNFHNIAFQPTNRLT